MEYLQSDEYVEYMKKNFEVRGFDNSESNNNLMIPEVNIFTEYLKLMNIKKDHKVLEVGCGLGRLLKEIQDIYNCDMFGIDKNPKLIEMAKIRVGNICKELTVSNAEKIEYPDEFFDRILCWGVYELCDQEQTFTEMIRCLKVGGLLLLTGKSNAYHPQDSEAYLAEVAITRKNIRYHFTNYDKMIKIGYELGVKPFKEIFFEMRGFFMQNKASHELKDHFYEWLVIFEKVANRDNKMKVSEPFSVQHSNTYLEKIVTYEKI